MTVFEPEKEPDLEPGTKEISKGIRNRFNQTKQLFLNSPDYIPPLSLEPEDIIRFLHSSPLTRLPLFIQARVVKVYKKENQTLVDLICTFSSRRDLVYVNKRLTKTLSSLVKSHYVKFNKETQT